MIEHKVRLALVDARREWQAQEMAAGLTGASARGNLAVIPEFSLWLGRELDRGTRPNELHEAAVRLLANLISDLTENVRPQGLPLEHWQFQTCQMIGQALQEDQREGAKLIIPGQPGAM